MNTKTITLGEFRKWTSDLSDDVEMFFSYGGGYEPIKAMDSIDENTLCVGGNLYDDKNIMGSIRVASFCKKRKE